MKVHVVGSTTGDMFSVWHSPDNAREEADILTERFPDLFFQIWELTVGESYAEWEEAMGR